MHTTDVGDARKDTALATRLFRAGRISLGKAASLSGLSVGEFVDHLGGLGIEIVRPDETAAGEPDDLSAWVRPQGPPGS